MEVSHCWYIVSVLPSDERCLREPRDVLGHGSPGDGSLYSATASGESDQHWYGCSVILETKNKTRKKIQNLNCKNL